MPRHQLTIRLTGLGLTLAALAPLSAAFAYDGTAGLARAQPGYRDSVGAVRDDFYERDLRALSASRSDAQLRLMGDERRADEARLSQLHWQEQRAIQRSHASRTAARPSSRKPR